MFIVIVKIIDLMRIMSGTAHGGGLSYVDIVVWENVVQTVAQCNM
jgi:hypothetical protein